MKQIIWRVGLGAFCLAGLGQVIGAQAGERRWALVVGIDRYQASDQIPALRCAVSDARELARVLIERGGFRVEEVFLFCNEEATRKEIMRRLGWLKDHAQPADTFLFFFAGHGVTRGGRGYLLPHDTDPTNEISVQTSALSVEEMHQILAEIPAEKKLLFLDACREPLTDKEQGRAWAENTLTDALSRGFLLKPKPGGASQSVVATFFACSPGQRSYEWRDQNHGFFTYFLLQGLQGAAADPAGKVTPVSLATYLVEEVPRAQAQTLQKDQAPWPELSGPGAGTLALTTTEVPAGGPGYVAVTSQPSGAIVFVDGQRQGETPRTVEVDLAGKAVRYVQVRLEREGYQPADKYLPVRPGQTTFWDGDGPLAPVIAAPAAVGEVLARSGNVVILQLRPGYQAAAGTELVLVRKGDRTRKSLARVQVRAATAEDRWSAEVVAGDADAVQRGDEVYAPEGGIVQPEAEVVAGQLRVRGLSRAEVFQRAAAVLGTWTTGEVSQDENRGTLKIRLTRRIGSGLVDEVLKVFKKAKVYVEAQVTEGENETLVTVEVYYVPPLLGGRKTNAETRELERQFLEELKQAIEHPGGMEEGKDKPSTKEGNKLSTKTAGAATLAATAAGYQRGERTVTVPANDVLSGADLYLLPDGAAPPEGPEW